MRTQIHLIIDHFDFSDRADYLHPHLSGRSGGHRLNQAPEAAARLLDLLHPASRPPEAP